MAAGPKWGKMEMYIAPSKEVYNTFKEAQTVSTFYPSHVTIGGRTKKFYTSKRGAV